MQRKIVVCRPDTIAVGVDPGPSQGAVAVICTDSSGRPEVWLLQEWRKDKRKQPRNRYRLWHGGLGAEWEEANGGVKHPDRLVIAAAKNAVAFASATDLSIAAGVENIQMYGPPRAGLLNLASSAGGHEALLRSICCSYIDRPSERVWVRQVAAVPSNARKKMTRQILTAAYEGVACNAGTYVVDWRCRMDGPTPSEHAVDAIGIALYAAGAQVVTPQERENDNAAENRP